MSAWAPWARNARADEADIPALVQAQLLSKVPGYDHGFRQRAGALVQVLILTNPARLDSLQTATLVEAALRRQPTIAGLPHAAFIMAFVDAPSLAAEVKRRSVSIVYLTPGLEEHLEPICKALEPLNVLSVATLSEYVRRCVVLGLQVVAGRPRILVHLEHAQRSGIRFRSELLQLATVYR